MKIRLHIGILFIATLLTLSSCEQKTKETIKANKQPNIVFIMADDHAVAAISAYEDWLSEIAPTPNIDRIANNGMLMYNTYNTNSICGPSRSAILTGKYSHVSGFFKNEKGGDFDGSQQTFPKLLQQGGYETAVVGKWHLGTVPTGFDYSKVMINHGGQGTYFDTVFLENGKDTIVERERHSTAQVAHDALKWLDNGRDKDKPFMLMYQFKAPHRPWTPAEEFKELFTEGDLPHPANFNDDYKGRKAASEQWMEIANHMNRKDLKVPPKNPESMTKWEFNKYNLYGNRAGEDWTPHDSLQGAELKNWKFQAYVKDYLRCVAGVDKAVGQMLDYLDENNLTENTIIVYTSDQGFYLGEHGWFDKRFMYEESFRMPFMIQYPGVIEPASVNRELLLNIDFAPTFLDFAGLAIPEDIQGTSFKKQLVNDKSAETREAVYYHYYEWPKWHNVQPHYGVRTDRYKLIHYYYSMDEWELFDLDTDKNEMNNLYGKAGYEEITATLKQQIKELQVEYKDDMSLEEMREMTDVVIERVYNESNLKTK
ncbi:MAG: sulfatase [Flavobacteriaceae bacterium]|nr:MAG: sulfatase [Flavobacteriaceae bacterium]